MLAISQCLDEKNMVVVVRVNLGCRISTRNSVRFALHVCVCVCVCVCRKEDCDQTGPAATCRTLLYILISIFKVLHLSMFGLAGPCLHNLDLPEQHPTANSEVADEAQLGGEEGVAAPDADQDHCHSNKKGACPNNSTSTTQRHI